MENLHESYRLLWEPTEEELTPYEHEYEEGGETKTVPVVKIWGHEYPALDVDWPEQRVFSIKRSNFLETVSNESAATLGEGYERRDRESFAMFLYDFAEEMLDAGEPSVEEATRRLALFLGANPPLVDFIVAQIDEVWLSESREWAKERPRFVSDGPLHRAIRQTREMLAPLTG